MLLIDVKLDLEMAFARDQDVMNLIEQLLRYLWKEFLHIELPNDPFRRITYQEAMAKYGSDKPDLRFDLEVNCFHFPLSSN